MRLSFKNFWGETFMLIPNINFWSDDDPEYAPHKYMFFIGWLWWGLRFYFGRSEDIHPKSVFLVRAICNEFRGENRYVIVHCVPWGGYVGDQTLDCNYRIAAFMEGSWRFFDTTHIVQTDAFRDAIRQSVPIEGNGLRCNYPVLSWKDESDARTVCDYLCREDEAIEQDTWELK